MFGKRTLKPVASRITPVAVHIAPLPDKDVDEPSPRQAQDFTRSEKFTELKKATFATLIESINLAELPNLEPSDARREIREVLTEILRVTNATLPLNEEEALLNEICNDVLGFGPLEPLLARDDITDIMINGARHCYIEVHGRLLPATAHFSDNQELTNICQRIANRVGRRVDEANPICDARLPDGSRVNIIFPPLALDGPVLTIRKFRRERLTLSQLVTLGTISPEGAALLEIIARSRCNVLVSGGTGSGKTTLLNCLTAHIARDERVITCEDAAELQLQRPHVVRLETRPPNLEGEGAITMRDLVRNCLRMRPERIIVGEVRGAEAFDLLQAMNTGHDGSMSTLHANSPREAIGRLEGMILMAGFQLPSRAIRRMIIGAVDIIIQVARMRDGRRRITHVTEIVGMEGEIVVTQDLMRFDLLGEDNNGRLFGQHRFSGISRPRFAERARYFGLERRLTELLATCENSEGNAENGGKFDG